MAGMRKVRAENILDVCIIVKYVDVLRDGHLKLKRLLILFIVDIVNVCLVVLK